MHNVLILCTGNSARSILAEAIFNREGQGRFKAFSAGSFPKGTVNPYALKLLESLNYETRGFSSKGWDRFAEEGAPKIDFVITVCDNAAGETCPVWIGHPMTAHWGIRDPADAMGNEVEITAAFQQAYVQLRRRIMAFMDIPFASLERISLQNRMNEIGHIDD